MLSRYLNLLFERLLFFIIYLLLSLRHKSNNRIVELWNETWRKLITKRWDRRYCFLSDYYFSKPQNNMLWNFLINLNFFHSQTRLFSSSSHTNWQKRRKEIWEAILNYEKLMSRMKEIWSQFDIFDGIYGTRVSYEGQKKFFISRISSNKNFFNSEK